jgi:hypothetical protein
MLRWIPTISGSIWSTHTDDSSVVISDSIIEIGSDAFAERDSLTAVTFESPSLVIRFLSYAFFVALISSLFAFQLPFDLSATIAFSIARVLLRSAMNSRHGLRQSVIVFSILARRSRELRFPYRLGMLADTAFPIADR